jgi:hypothetical protein
MIKQYFNFNPRPQFQSPAFEVRVIISNDQALEPLTYSQRLQRQESTSLRRNAPAIDPSIMPVNVALDIFVVIPRSDNRELDSVLLCMFAERNIVEDNGDFDDSGGGGSGGSAAVMVARRREGVSFIVLGVRRSYASGLIHREPLPNFHWK